MENQTLNLAIRGTLAEHGISTLREAADATGLDKDKIARRYRGEVAWTFPDLEKVAAAVGLTVSELTARAERGAA